MNNGIILATVWLTSTIFSNKVVCGKIIYRCTIENRKNNNIVIQFFQFLAKLIIIINAFNDLYIMSERAFENSKYHTFSTPKENFKNLRGLVIINYLFILPSMLTNGAKWIKFLSCVCSQTIGKYITLVKLNLRAQTTNWILHFVIILEL